jgi:hypothetical protein
MAKGAILFLPAAFLAGGLWAAPPAQTSMTVDELSKLLTNLQGASDKNAARELARLKLTERVSLQQLSRWETGCPGTGSREALLALADAAAFLRPPAEEIPQAAAPDAAAQQQMLALVFDYVQRTLPKLPNFLAQRTTIGFAITTENQLHMIQEMGGLLQKQTNRRLSYQALGPAKASRLPEGQLYFVGSTTEMARYRDGHEELEPTGGSTGQGETTPLAMTTEGEFGPMLSVILDEAPREQIVWDHWERGAAGARPDENFAVFHFSVPRDRSRFAVVVTQDQIPDFPAYQGEITVDPSSGTVYRITIEANVRDSTMKNEASIMVEFSQEEIGGINYILPIHSVGIVRSFDAFADLDANPPPIPFLTSINDIGFTGYHVFRTKSRIVSGAGRP